MTLIGDGSIELQSIKVNNKNPTSLNNSASAEKPSIMDKKSVIATDPLQNEAKAAEAADAASPNETGPVSEVSKPVKMGTSKKTMMIIATIAVISLVGGITLGLCFMMIYNSILFKQLALTPTSTSYEMWKEIPIPMYLNLYLYNWTNPEEFRNGATVKPNFVEMGPYVFEEQHIKVNQVWNDNKTITFQQRRTWLYQESMSNGSLDDQVTNLNIIATTVGHIVRNQGWFIRSMVNRMLRLYDQDIVVTKTAGQLIFEGYDDPFLDFARRLNISALNIPFDKFGWFYARNGSDTYDGVFNMLTGAGNISNLGILQQWNYRDRTDDWHGECNTIRGTTGELWPPLTDKENIEIFAPDICTSLVLTRTNDSKFLDVSGHTFVTDSGTFDNGTSVPSRACYCDTDTCEASGVLDVSACKFGAPAYISLPHFYKADKSYRDAVTGMNPEEDKYNFEMTLEPNTGIPLDVKAQMQINVLAAPIPDITIFTNIPRTFIPMLWFRQDATLTNEFAGQIKFLLILPTLGHAISIVIACIGLALALTALYLWLRTRARKGENQLLIAPDDTGDTPRTDPVTL